MNAEKQRAADFVNKNGLCPTSSGDWLDVMVQYAEAVEREKSKSVLQAWVMSLGLRHQGTLLTAVRGCDTAPKNDHSKLFVRCLRAEILNAHCGDPEKAKTFIERTDGDELLRRFNFFRRNCDHYPHHYLMHLLHAIEIIGYKGPAGRCGYWRAFYVQLCLGLHLTPETEYELDHRLNADEETFAARDHTCDGAPCGVLKE
jgi:hypothetical protein